MCQPTRESAPTRVARLFQGFGLLSFTLLATAALAECGTRVVDAIAFDAPLWRAEKTGALYMEHPYLFRVPRPGARFQRYRVNAHGFRGPEFSVPKPEGVFRILTLGGSAVWDSDVTADDRTWSARLGEKLNARLTRDGRALRVEVVNGGVPGYTSAETFMNLVWRGVPLEPDMVIVYQGYNDYKPNRHPRFTPDYSHWRALDHTPLRRLARSSRAVYYLTRFAGALQPRPPAFDTAAESGVTAFQDNLASLVVLARARGIEPVLSTYGLSATERNLRDHPEKLRELERFLPMLTFAGVLDAHRRYNQAVLDLGERLGVPVVRIAEGVPAAFDHYTDHVHFTDRGADRAAEVFAIAVYSLLPR